MATKYQVVTIYKKRSNLLAYYEQDAATNQHLPKAHYEKERNVCLKLMTRREGSKLFCKIKCPINPLPVKGEFEAPNFNVLRRFLQANGWTECESISLRDVE